MSETELLLEELELESAELLPDRETLAVIELVGSSPEGGSSLE